MKMGWKIVAKAKRRPIRTFAAVMLLLALGSVAGKSAAYLFSVKDPNHDAFRPDKFAFEKYATDSESLLAAFTTLFPPGSTKEKVDRLLVDIAGATAKDYRSGNSYDFVTYQHKASPVFPVWIDCPASMTWTFRVHFDSDERVTDVKFSGPCI